MAGFDEGVDGGSSLYDADLFLPNLHGTHVSVSGSAVLTKETQYLYGFARHDSSGVKQTHGLIDRRHVKDAYATAVITNSEVAGICRKLQEPHTRAQRVVQILRRRICGAGPRLEGVAVSGIEDHLVSLAVRLPNCQPPPVRAPP